MNAVVSQRKELNLPPNAERPCDLDVSTYDGRYIHAYAMVSRKVRGNFKCSCLARATAPAADSHIYRMAPWSQGGQDYPESWSLVLGSARFHIAKADVDKLIAEFAFRVEGSI